MKIFVTLGLALGGLDPVDELTGISFGPAIAHVSGDHWLIAYTRPPFENVTKVRIDVRPYTVAVGGGFGSPLVFASPLPPNISEAEFSEPAVGRRLGM